MLNIYLDGKRETPIGWTRFYTSHSLISYLVDNFDQVINIYLENNLGENTICGTGYDILIYMEAYCYFNKVSKLPNIIIHSNNMSDRIKMLQKIINIERICKVNTQQRSLH